MPIPVVLRARFADRIVWMKLSELARYWAAKELTAVRIDGRTVQLAAPFACPGFTLQIERPRGETPLLVREGEHTTLREVSNIRDLISGTWHRDQRGLAVCVDLPRGVSSIDWA